MKETELPQEKGALQDFTELCYVTDDEGNYTTLSSSGWEVKSIALEASLSRLQEQIDEAKADVLAGHKSPIVYYCSSTVWIGQFLPMQCTAGNGLSSVTPNLRYSKNYLLKRYKNMLRCSASLWKNCAS